MGVDAIRIRVQIQRFLVISIRTCYKSMRKHPFLVGFVCFLIFLYRSFPFLFSLLVSASPILVCTAILLGTLLSFGEPNIPEIEKEKEEEEEEVTREISSLKTGVIGDETVVVEKDENVFVESFVGRRKDTSEEAIEEESWGKNGASKIEGDDGVDGYVPLIHENSRNFQFEKQVIEDERDFDYLELEKKKEIYQEKKGTNEVFTDGEAADSHYSLIPNGRNENLHSEDDKSPGDSIEAEHVDHLDSQHSSWKRATNDDEEDDEDEDASDSGSDGAESSSPDASMADIIPMLDELHPLLHEGDPQPAHMSDDGSDAGSEESHESNEGSVDSDEDIEHQADEEEDGDDDNDNEEEEEEARGKDDESKSAIKWTEDDQKNLMDLGTSELERNIRLESLIARRRARKSMRVMAEKNLIDLDGTDLPLNMPVISTTRSNPFDLPYDPFDDVPGSAPSILLPRHNPFDLPYDSNEEKPDLKGDSFEQEFSAIQHKEPFFRRHESFNVGSSVLGAAKQERQDHRWKPYFVPERFSTEETSYRTFHRQLSEASESKLSSVPDTESVSSAVEEEKKLNEEDGSQETDMISSVDHASVLVQCGSLSSEDVASLDIENIDGRDAHDDEDEITLGDVENNHELDSSSSTLGGATHVELNTTEILLRMDPGEEEYSSRSSLSSLSEVDDKISNVKGSLSPEQIYGQTEESHISTQTSLDTEFHFMSEVADENQHRELVLEPRGNLAAESVMQTSFDSDFHFASGVEESNRCMEPASEPTSSHIEDSGISLKASTHSDSHFMSEMVDNNQRKEPVLLPRGSHISESGIITRTSVDTDSPFTSGVVDDNQHKEPVYDSSPQAVDRLLSFLSISSDTQGEASQMDSPPTLAVSAGKESEMHNESTEKNASGYKELHEGSLQELSLQEFESRSREVTESEPHVMDAGLVADDLTFNGQNGQTGFMKQELGAEHDAVDLLPSSSSNGFVKEGLVYNEKVINDELDQQHSSSYNAETIVIPHQDVIEKLDFFTCSNHAASAETILHVLEEQHHSVAVDVSLNSKLSSSESKSQIPSSSIDAEIHVNNCQTTGEKLDSVASGNTQMPSDVVVAEQVLVANRDASSSEIKDMEELSVRNEENLMHSSSHDATIAADLLEDADVKLVSSGSSNQHMSSEAKSPFELEKQFSWSDKAVVGQSLTDHGEFQEPSITPEECTSGVKVQNNVDVPEVFDHETSESGLVPQQGLEYKSKVDEVDFRDSILDKIVYEDSGHTEAHRSSVVEETVNEDEDEIKEIDEGLLSELDTVGDFRVKEVVGESLHDEQVQSHNYNLLSRDSSGAETKPELPVLEVRSVTDIDLAFKQLHGVDAEEAILSSMVELQPVDGESRVPEETNSDLLSIEASSLEDIHVAMKQSSERNAEEISKWSDLKGGPAEVNEGGSSSSMREFPVLEIRTTNDIDLAFKQLSEGVDVEEVILPSTVEQHVVENEPRDTHQSSFDLPAVEGRSMEDLHNAMRQASEENIEEMSKPSDSNEGPVEVNIVSSSCSARELPVLEIRAVDDIDLAFRQLSEGVDVEEVILPGTSEQHVVVNESRGSQQSSSDLQVPGAVSLEELHIAMKQVPEGNNEEVPQSSDPTQENLSRTLQVSEMGPAKDIESSTDEAAKVSLIQPSGLSTAEFDSQKTSTEATHSPK